MELVMVGMIIPLLVGGVWGIYYTVVNTFHEEQRGALIQAEGELILNLIIKQSMSSPPNRLPSSSRLRQQLCAILNRT